MSRPCPACGNGNRDHYCYCSGCGTALGRHCIRCGFFALASDAHCGGCGVELGENAATGFPGSAPADPVETPLDMARGLDLETLQSEASRFRAEIEKQDQMDQGDIDALFSDA